MSVDITTIIIDGQQLTEADIWLDINDVCERCCLQPELLGELVELGLVTQEMMHPEQRLFRTTVLPTLHQALRLKHELDLDWQGVAVAMDLLEQVRELRQQVHALERQLTIHE